MTTGTTAGSAAGAIGRYVLEDLVAESNNSALWRAEDPALRRPVGIRLIPVDDRRVPELVNVARRVGAVHDRRLVEVLDVVETDDYVAVVTEWAPGRSWGELLQEPWSPQESAIVAYEVALALQVAHEAGVSHGRIRPSSVIITDNREVRLRGLGIDAALYGVQPPGDPRAADVHGVGALLFAGLTARWPTEDHARTIDKVRTVHPHNGILPDPAAVTAGVPDQLNDIAKRCLIGCQPPRGQWPFPDVTAVVTELGRAIEGEPPTPTPPPIAAPDETSGSSGKVRILIFGLIAVLTLALFAVLGGRWLSEPAAAPVPSPTATTSGEQDAVAQSSSPEPEPTPSPVSDEANARTPRAMTIINITDFDPQGGDGTENPELVPQAVDKDDSTAWTTVAYVSSGMNPKDGTGLLVDLGSSRPIRQVDLQLLGSGTDVEVRIADELGDNFQDYELLTGAVAAGERLSLRVPIPVTARYVLVWLTNVPYTGSTYQGGIREVQVKG